MVKAISGHSTPKSAMAMAIVAIPLAPLLHLSRLITTDNRRQCTQRHLYSYTRKLWYRKDDHAMRRIYRPIDALKNFWTL